MKKKDETSHQYYSLLLLESLAEENRWINITEDIILLRHLTQVYILATADQVCKLLCAVETQPCLS